jgi:hypothetical protein
MSVRALGALALAALAAALAGCDYATPTEENWVHVRRGMSRNEVIARLGDPYMAQGSRLPDSREDLYLYWDTSGWKASERSIYYVVLFGDDGLVEDQQRYVTAQSPREVLNEVQQKRLAARERALAERRAEPPAAAEEPASLPRALLPRKLAGEE